MTLRPRFASLTVVALLTCAAIIPTLPARAAEPVAQPPRRAGLDRVVRPVVQAPIYAPGQAIHVPRELARLSVEPVEGLPPLPDVDWVGLAPIIRSLRDAVPAAVDLINPNVRINNTAGDPAGSTQSETSIAALGMNLVAGWNDGKNFNVNPGGSGYGYSSDMGATWTDGGVPPAAGVNDIYEGDPSLTVDNAGNFYYANLYTPDGGFTSGLSVNRGTFSGTSFTFNPPVVAASSVSDFLDKEWIAADPVNGNVYLSWTRFLGAGGNRIEFSRSTNNGATWSAPLVLTNSALESVQGSRPAVGPSGEIYVVYYVYDFGSNNNYIRIRKSTDQGLTFGPEVTVGAGAPPIFSNFGSGPPGFNRQGAVGFPGIAVDRSASANNGRVYVTWEESVDYYNDPLGYGAGVAESEPNGFADPPDPFTLGDALLGTLSSTADQDWFSFSGTAGQTVIFFLVPNPNADGYLRMFCGGRNTANRAAFSYLGGGQALIVFTLPSTATYYVRVLAASASIGNYVVYTGVHIPAASDVGRDHRDVVFSSSTNGTIWTPKKVVNDDPPLFDNTFPEVAVDALGDVHFDWYDHRLDPACGIGTDIFYTHSGNAGGIFVPSTQVNDGGSINWNNVSSNLAPNMGDYSALVADGVNVYANFTDGRQGTPDSWVAKIVNDAPTPVLLSLIDATAEPDRVSLAWHAPDASGLVATLFRRPDGGAWTALGELSPDGTGRLAFEDRNVAAGWYSYRLGVREPGGAMEYQGEVRIEVPAAAAAFALSVRNPATRELRVAFALPSAQPARLELLDISGRAIKSMRLNGQRTGEIDLAAGLSLRPGLYLINLVQDNRRITNKAAYLP